MGIFARMWRPARGWLLTGIDRVEEPEVILDRARDEMRREFATATENLIQAIATRNQLRSVLQKQLNRSAHLEAKARVALKHGEVDLARQILAEKQTYDLNIEGLKAQLAQAEQAVESEKAGIQQMEVQFRQRAAQRLALVADWKQPQVPEQLDQTLSAIPLEGHR